MKLPAPRTTFLLDGLGGIVTAIMLCLVLRRFHHAIGLSPGVLVTLGLFGVVYGAYSLGCFRLVKKRWGRALAVIIGANILYCVVSALVVVAYRGAMTTLGISYFVAEIAVIAALVGLEVAVLKRTAKA